MSLPRPLYGPSRYHFAAALTAVLGAVLIVSCAVRQGPTLQELARQRAATPSGMVFVPAGPFRMGTDEPDADEDARPRHRVSLPSFYIGRTEVTNAQFWRFRPSFQYPAGHDCYPVTGVTYDDAEAYCRWAGGRLPAEAEWEK